MAIHSLTIHGTEKQKGKDHQDLLVEEMINRER